MVAIKSTQRQAGTWRSRNDSVLSQISEPTILGSCVARNIKRPPGPRGGILTGNLAAYDRDRLRFLHWCQQEYGDWVSLDSRTVLVSDADAVGQILTATDAAFSLESGSDDGAGGPATLAGRAPNPYYGDLEIYRVNR